METYFWLLILLVMIVLSLVLIRVFKKLSGKEQTVSGNVIILSDKNFRETVEKGVSVVDFWAPWCMPCRVQNPIINQLADELKGKVKICKLNIEENKKIAIQLKIKSIPNIIIFKEGKVVKQLIGIKPKTLIMKELKLLIK
jgi:thioredoxin 1